MHIAVGFGRKAFDTTFMHLPILKRVGPELRPEPNAIEILVPLASKGWHLSSLKVEVRTQQGCRGKRGGFGEELTAGGLAVCHECH